MPCQHFKWQTCHSSGRGACKFWCRTFWQPCGLLCLTRTCTWCRRTIAALDANSQHAPLSGLPSLTRSTSLKSSSEFFASCIAMLSLQVEDTLAEIQERHDAVKELEKGLLDLHQVFLDMAVLVEAQGEMLDNIEAQVTFLHVLCGACMRACVAKGRGIVRWTAPACSCLSSKGIFNGPYSYALHNNVMRRNSASLWSCNVSPSLSPPASST